MTQQTAPDVCVEPDHSQQAAFTLPDLFQDLSDAVVFADTDRRIRWINAAAAAIFGYDAAELIGEETRVLFADAAGYDRVGVERFNDSTQGPGQRYEISYRRKNGEVFSSQTTGSPIRGADGTVQGFLAIVRDETETQVMETLLRRLYAISSCPEQSGDQKIHRILQLGCECFQTSTAIVSKVQGNTYTVLFSESEISPVEAGTEFELGDTYCVHTLNVDHPVAFHKASRSHIASHPCYTMFRLETYIGVPLIIDGAVFGTLNFTCLDDRPPFLRRIWS